MSSMSDFLEGELIKHIFRTGSFTKPTVLAVGLFTATPSDSGGGTEVSGGSYARASLNPADANWSSPDSTSGIVVNSTTISFPTPTGSWGTVTHFGIFNATTSGDLLFWGPISPSQVIVSGDTVQFQQFQLKLTFA